MIALHNQIKKMKIVMMISQEYINSHNGDYRNQFQKISSISGKGTCLVITHADEKLRNERKMKYFLWNIIENMDENTYLKNFINDAEKRLFIFECPDDLDIGSIYDKFTKDDMNRFMKFIKNEYDLYEPNNNISFLDGSQLMFILSLINRLDKMNSIIHEFGKYILNDFEEEIEFWPEELQKWKSLIMKLKMSEYKSSDIFISELKKKFKDEKYQMLYEKINFYQFLYSIFVKIDFNEIKTSDIVAYQQFMKSLSHESFISGFQKELIVIEKKIIQKERAIKANESHTEVESKMKEIESRLIRLEEQNKILREVQENMRRQQEENARIQEQNQFLKGQVELLKMIVETQLLKK